ncbi:permease prefix domain 1-containing protein [Microbacterium capsulatum]|uniref:Permease prefix domain 1-containing protein n=1 Tax=Microbacterium capsulatum TaxID=3041921 RepID=A0ABU0XNL4_9MICO|nr:permease prefix domain 1-containing protein [Microbacterium sp. ASV81]MDQ4215700.1 permease prefix domain 1-containing protein [Microbacterium sp. ASV81]
MTDAIDRYLEQLADRLGAGQDTWRLLAETDGHLRDAQAALQEKGMTKDEAAETAVQRFGDPATVARARSPRRRVLGLFSGLWLVVALGFVVVGVSGLVSWAMEAIAGPAFLAGDTNGVTYTAARCGDFLGFFPQAGSCAAAAAMHHSDEIVSERLAAGVLGLLLLLGWLLVRRIRGARPIAREDRRMLLIASAVAYLGVGLVGFGSGALSVLLDIVRGLAIAGVGVRLSDGAIALLAGVVAIILLARFLRRGVAASAGMA